MTLIHPVSNWTHWATLRRHPCLSRAAISASSQVNPIFRRSLLITPLQFALGRPGPLLYPGTCQYSACCGMHLWSIRKTCPSQRSRLSQYVVDFLHILSKIALRFPISILCPIETLSLNCIVLLMALEKFHDLETRFRGRSKALEMTPFDRSYTISYSHFILSLALACTFSEI